MQNFSLLIKPASADCNLRCSYCFYLKKSSLYPNSIKHRMNEETLEKMISSFMRTSQPNYAFGWQGGEPTLMGLNFFEKVIEFQQKYGKSGLSVSNGLQTNAILIDDKMAIHLAKYNYLLGVSLDGPAIYHDKFRLTNGGKGTQAQVLKSTELLNTHSVEFNILSMINSLTAKPQAVKEIYSYFRNHNFKFLQFIPCVEFDKNNNPLPFSLSPNAFGEHLCTLFDLWYEYDTRDVSIRLFDSILMLLVDNVANVCHLGKDCRQYFVVEHNGDIYPCDFFVDPQLRLGNINANSWEELSKSSLYRDFGTQKTQMSLKCTDCKFLNICSGDCLKHRQYGNITNPKNISYLCEGWKMFFEHTLDRFNELAQSIRNEREEQHRQYIAQQPSKNYSVGRNTTCPCGSGKKYKKCCM